MVWGLYTTCAPTRRPTQAYAACEGAYAITSQLPGAYLRGQTLSLSVEVHRGSSSWKIATFQCKCSFGSSGSKIRNAVQVRIQHLSKDLAAKRSTHPQCLESLRECLRECLRGAYAEPTRRLQNKQKEGKRNKFLHTWQTVMICSTNAYAKSLREG